MSGFIAIFNTDGAPVDRCLVEKLTNTLRFKGPDKQKVWIDGSAGLGHTLFRTTSEAQYDDQPFSFDGHIWIIGSIRIDAREELVQKLGLTGRIKLGSTPDSELLLHAYQTWGRDCLSHIIGDFSFAIWDGTKRELFCAKDRFGMRQLYYAQKNNTYIISNSIHCIRQYPTISARLNDRAIGDFLLFGDLTWPDKQQTAFAEINALQPAHAIHIREGAMSISRYWDFPQNIPILKYRHEQEYLEHFQSIFSLAVKDRLRTNNNNVVISMSGGMDSSAIAATAREIQKTQQPQLKLSAVTLIYQDTKFCQERYYAEIVAKHLNLPAAYIEGNEFPYLVSANQWARPLEMEQPTLWLEIHRKAIATARVMLTGAAGDNLLEFSPIFSSALEMNPVRTFIDILKLRSLYGGVPPLGTGLKAKFNQLRGIYNNGNNQPYPYPPWLNREFETEYGLKDRWHTFWSRESAHHARHPKIYSSLVEPDWNTDDICMQCNFPLPEQRDPFLDIRLLEFVLSIPSIPWLYKKHILRKSMRQKLPVEVINRPKTPLGGLNEFLLKQEKSSWAYNWKPESSLQPYIDETRMANLISHINDPLLTYVNQRPLILNCWLKPQPKTG